MMERTKTYDVFLSISADAVAFAVTVESHLSSAGLNVYNPFKLWAAGQRHSDLIREELAASLSVILVLGNPPRLTPTLAVEIGAAMAWKSRFSHCFLMSRI